jgi:indolepyruvate decarboxylase
MGNVTVIEYVLGRLKEEGVSDVFGVPGDYVYPVLDGILADPDLQWRGSCNELNAGYAADGYSRIKGLGVFACTYGSELGAHLALAGSYGENSTTLMLTGFPSLQQQASGHVFHHMLGNHDYDLFNKMAEPLSAARAIITVDNCVEEFERVLAAMKYHKRPGVLAFQFDDVHMPLASTEVPAGIPLMNPQSNPEILAKAIDHIVTEMSSAKTAAAVVGIAVQRKKLRAETEALLNATGLPYATPLQDKTALYETHDGFMGTWCGKFANLPVEDYLVSCDKVLAVGYELHYFNAGFFTTGVDFVRQMINIRDHSVHIGETVYEQVEMKDVLQALTDRLPQWEGLDAPSKLTPFTEAAGSGEDPITTGFPFYKRLEQFLRPDDILVIDPSSAVLPGSFVNMPEGVDYISQALAASIGFGTPAALGAAVAAPERRVVMLGGEGAHQLTAQEIGQFYKFGLKPVFIVINNDGYLVERYTCRDPESSFNDLPQWQYSKLPEVFGCKDWYSVKVETTGELDAALEKINNSDQAAYVEIICERYDMPPMADVMFELTRPKFGQALTWDEWKSAFDKGNNITAVEVKK